MGLISWMLGQNARQIEEHSFDASYSFLFGPTTAGGRVVS